MTWLEGGSSSHYHKGNRTLDESLQLTTRIQLMLIHECAHEY
jgi:hypothetical protein